MRLYRPIMSKIKVRQLSFFFICRFWVLPIPHIYIYIYIYTRVLEARQGFFGTARWHGPADHDGTERPGTATHGMARHGTVFDGRAR